MSERRARAQFTAEIQRSRRRASGKPGLVSDGTDGTRPDITNADLLQAICELREEIAHASAAPPPVRANGAANGTAGAGAAGDADDVTNYHAEDVRIEIAQMVRSIARAKNEIATISHPMSDDDRLATASTELDAIVVAAETATNDILKANEEIGTLVDQIAAECQGNDAIVAKTEQIAEQLIKIFEASSFQDITGQRIAKVVKTLQFIQDRILAMIAIWGVEAFENLPVAVVADGDENDEKDLLNGPQLENQGISQAEIDALFG